VRARACDRDRVSLWYRVLARLACLAAWLLGCLPAGADDDVFWASQDDERKERDQRRERHQDTATEECQRHGVVVVVEEVVVTRAIDGRRWQRKQAEERMKPSMLALS